MGRYRSNLGVLYGCVSLPKAQISLPAGTLVTQLSRGTDHLLPRHRTSSRHIPLFVPGLHPTSQIPVKLLFER